MGVATATYPEVAGFDTRLVAGTVLVLGGAYTSGEMSNLAVGLGSGMLASFASEYAAGMVP